MILPLAAETSGAVRRPEKAPESTGPESPGPESPTAQSKPDGDRKAMPFSDMVARSDAGKADAPARAASAEPPARPRPDMSIAATLQAPDAATPAMEGETLVAPQSPGGGEAPPIDLTSMAQADAAEVARVARTPAREADQGEAATEPPDAMLVESAAALPTAANASDGSTPEVTGMDAEAPAADGEPPAGIAGELAMPAEAPPSQGTPQVTSQDTPQDTPQAAASAGETGAALMAASMQAEPANPRTRVTQESRVAQDIGAQPQIARDPAQPATQPRSAPEAVLGTDDAPELPAAPQPTPAARPTDPAAAALQAALVGAPAATLSAEDFGALIDAADAAVEAETHASAVALQTERAALTQIQSAPAAATRDSALAGVVARQIGVAITAGDGKSIEIRLDPPELGRVRIELVMADDVLTATITADRPEVADLMRRHADQLLREFAQAGHDNVDLGFGSNGGAQGDAEYAGAAQSQGSAAAAAPVEPPVIRRLVTAGLDLRV